MSEWSKSLLFFGKGNAKLGADIYHFSIPAGHTCPYAKTCLSKAHREGGGLVDGPETEVRCFSASDEAQYEGCRNLRWHNFDLLRGKTQAEMTKVIADSLPVHAKIVRIHIGGDFFSQAYFDSWLQVARQNPGILFYAYTKSLKFWVARMDTLPENLRLTASRGGKDDDLIETHNLRCAEIVFSESEANIKGLEIDHDDSHAYGEDPKSFALLIHGTQPKGSEAAKALSALRKSGWTGYSKKKKESKVA